MVSPLERGYNPKPMKEEPLFLPISKEDLIRRGWDHCDIILVTGDAYVDHPSYGTALIGRVLENAGFKVGVIAQPDWKSPKDFLALGRPKLFFGVSAGNLDSMVSHYTASRKPRRMDEYAPGGKAGLRPNRASIVYTSRLKELFPGIPVVLGGIEASLRRFAHFDYWDEDVRRSILIDSKADLLVYGMGEKQIVEIARRLQSGEEIKKINQVRGTVSWVKDAGVFEGAVQLPSFEEVKTDQEKFNEAFKIFYQENDPVRGRPVIQKHGDRYVMQQPPAFPLTSKELDHLYQLPFVRAWHPVYDRQGGVPGFETVRFSITSHRGCAGECSFCSLFAHQGRMIQSRSKASILCEVKRLAGLKGFKGTITDIGGPTANLYGAECLEWDRAGACQRKQCMMPVKCKNLRLGYEKTVELWREVMQIPGVKHLFIQSGLRYDLLIEKESDGYLQALCESHISGRLKVAPEHAVESVLRLMNKPSIKTYEKFKDRFESFSRKAGKEQYLVNYWISAHPGATLTEAKDLAGYLKTHRLHPEQVQDFMPLPMTVSSCMYYTGKHPLTGIAARSEKTYKEREAQRLLVQPKTPKTGKRKFYENVR